jgi:nucleotide-binding universal stress UspA family protein
LVNLFGKSIISNLAYLLRTGFEDGNKLMKLLIGYDGSACSEAALDDLKTAGLPNEIEALVMTVAEVWLPPPPNDETLSEYAKDLQTHPQFFKAYERNAQAITEAEAMAKYAQNRLRQNFPAWKIKAEANYGSAAWEIIKKANEIDADLIVVGSHGHSAIGRFFLGSISQKVLTEAHCSVRVARGRVEVDPMPSRILIGFDGSTGANAAVEAVASRNWREQSDVKLVAVTNPITPSAIGRFVSPIADWVEDANAGERKWLEKSAESSLQKLQKTGLNTTFLVEAGNPKQILAQKAERWHADSIFVGAAGFGSRLEKFFLGSVSAAVAARAHCSVEIVR